MEREALKQNEGGDQTQNKFQQEAMKLFACKDGNVVTDPKHCREAAAHLPQMNIDGLAKA